MSYDRYHNFPIDLSGVKTGNYLDVGVHSVFIYDADGIEYDNQDRPYVTYVFRAPSGQIHTERYYLHKENLWKFKLLAVAAGIPEDAKVTPDQLIGKRVLIHLVRRAYNGKEYTNIDRVESASQVDPSGPPDFDEPPLTEDDFREYPKGGDPYDFV